MSQNSFDILIIGGGHAGVEAAYIASQFDLKIGLISMPNIGLASAPCNPSIGGVGKGQVVRELDALGGLAGKLADLSGIQFRTLNDSKGYAVQSTRVQIDKLAYSRNAEIVLSEISNLTIIREKVLSLSQLVDGNYQVVTNCSTWNSKKLILTVGTFLNGKLHLGEKQTSGGRFECDNSKELGDFLSEIETVSARFKTGTPPRLDKNSINYSKLEEQPSDETVLNFHCLHEPFGRTLTQVSCYLARTNDKTMNIIRDNKERSPMFNGQIKGVGARYCPSIEDKAYRYPDKNIHHVFIEPESLELETMYPSGISSSLPEEVQEAFVHSIEGLENAKILVPGYAVEYDVVNTTKLNLSLEYKAFKGLYFAGQVNGTSGYEEAAGQGYIAGVNAALSLTSGKSLTLTRDDSYIGVMIEDLVTNLRDEPYRLFTARSENRLAIREDNAILRMAKYRETLGLKTELDLFNENFIESFNSISSLLDTTYISPDDLFFGNSSYEIPRRMSLTEFIKMSHLDPIGALSDYLIYSGFVVPHGTIRAVAISKKYDGYITRSTEQYSKLKKLDQMPISWEKIVNSGNVSFECKQRIKTIQPSTFGQLKMMEGIRPATLAVVASGAL